jgi:Rps23 Pro-64 3,4-dihydroxylase Tpa1-like proline 4-hydroxylase
MEGFLTSGESQQLLQNVLGREAEFREGTVIEHGATTPVVNERVRRVKTLDDLGRFESLLGDHIKANLSEVMQRLKYPPFPIGHIEIQATASGDGDYFRIHKDSDEESTREITFVYFFHREPQRFSGGELRLFETSLENGRQVPTDRHQTIVPRPNVAVFMPSRHEHEVLPTRVPSRQFADSRFTITGWVHRAQ